MNEKPKKKVKLHRDTIKALKEADLTGVAGGDLATCTGESTICWSATPNCDTRVHCATQ